jgi:hypothetical protein
VHRCGARAVPTPKAPTPSVPPKATAGLYAAWNNKAAGVVSHGGGARGSRAAAELELLLAEQAKDPWWTELVKVLRRIVAGEHGDDLTQSLVSCVRDYAS